MTGGRFLKAGLAAGAVAALLAGSAQAAVLVDQVPSGEFTVPTYPSFAGNATQTNQAADDFTVPPGQVWKPASVDTFGLAQSGAAGDAIGNAWIYGDGGAGPGGQLFVQGGIALAGASCQIGQACNPRFPLANAPTLPPGRYWLSVQTQGSYNWWWAVLPPDLAAGSPAVWQNPGDGSGTGCVTYTPLIDCLPVLEPGDGSDMIYRLSGDLIDSRFSLGGFESNGKRISLRATFPDPGKAKISGKKVKPASKKVRAGATKLPVKLTKGAKRKLENGRRVKLKVAVKFTASGGVPFKRKASVTVVPVRAAAAPALRLAH